MSNPYQIAQDGDGQTRTLSAAEVVARALQNRRTLLAKLVLGDAIAQRPAAKNQGLPASPAPPRR